MAREGHFPFWRPIAVTLLFVAVPTALFFGAKFYTATLWGDPGHEREECVATAGMAAYALQLWHFRRNKRLLKDPIDVKWYS